MSSAVEVASAGPRQISESVESVGNVESPYRIEIAPRTSGRIAFLEVREGDQVKKGQLLLKIDPSDLEGAVIQQRANVAEARSRLAQAQMTQGAASVGVTSQIRQQQASVASAQADLNQVRRSYDAQVQGAGSQVSSAESSVRNAEAVVVREKANLANAQTKYDRTYSLYRQGFIASQDVDDARTAVDVQKGAVAVAQGQLESSRAQLDVQKQNLEVVKRKGQSDIEASKAKLTQAQAGLSLAKANQSQTPAYRENLAALRASVDAAIAQLGQAQSRLSDTAIRSPIDGTVTARKADPGALAGPGSPALEVQFLDWLYVTAAFPIDASTQVREGKVARITVDALPGRSFTGAVTNVNPAADPQSRQFTVRIRLANPGRNLRPGMYARVSVQSSLVAAAVVVPREAVKTDQLGDSTVTVVDPEGVAHVRPVKVGVDDDRGIQILEGVAAGERVVVLSYARLRDGQKVTVAGQGAGQGGGQGRGGGEGRGRQRGGP